MNNKEKIARRAVRELSDGLVVNLGIGIPTLVASYLDKNIDVTFQSENGFLGLAECQEPNSNLVNAGGQLCGLKLGAAIFDSALSFGLIRGKHVDVCILGALQVDEEGNLANWMVPGKMVPGMGGAMDLVVGAKKVIIVMEHNTKDGAAKIIPKCVYPLTAVECVSMIISEKAVFSYINGQLVLQEISEGLTIEDIKNCTDAEFVVSSALKTIEY